MNVPSDNDASRQFTPLRFGIFLALLIFASFPQVILGLETFVARDFGFFAYPLAHFQQQSVWHGELPFWNPYNNCGVPFLAQWNTMPLYPPALFYLALPLKWSLGMFSLLHLWWAGFGMFFLARRWTGNNFAAAFAGTVFAFNGYSINLLMWPSHIATFSWLPWVILAVELAWREGMENLIVAAFVGAIQMLAGGPETIFLTWLIASALWLQQFISGRDASSPPRIAMLWRFPLVVALVISLTLPQLLPFLDLVAHAQRNIGFADLRWSMPGTGLTNFLVPMAFGATGSGGVFFQPGQYMTSSYYLGLGTLWLALLTLVVLRERRVWLLGGIIIVSLAFALGEHTPVLPTVRKWIPQLSMITYPIKYVMVAVFAAPLLAAFALTNFDRIQKRVLPLGALLLTLIFAVVLWTQLAPLPGDNSSLALTNGLSRAAFLILVGLILFALMRTSKSPLLRSAPLLLLLVAWADVYTHEPTQNPTVQPWVYQPDLSREKLALDPQPELGGSRAMVSPMAAHEFITFAASDPKNNFVTKRLGYCANCNLLDAAPKVDGFFSLTPRESDAVLSLFYSLTNVSYPPLENFLGVSHITAADAIYHWQTRINFLPLVTAGQKPFFLADSNALIQLAQSYFDARKVVFLSPEEKPFVTVSNFTTAKVLSSKFSNHTVDIEAEADAPALVVIAQTYYHNWRAEIDGQPARLLRANVAFQAVEMPAGKHRIRLDYHDRAFEIGAAIAVCMWVNCFVSLIAMVRSKMPAAEPDPDEEDDYL
jgi:hypothetical protein